VRADLAGYTVRVIFPRRRPGAQPLGDRLRGEDRAEILLTHRGADHPATLKMFLEDGDWKAGLVETFWSR